MALLTETQKMISKALLSRPKSMEEIQQETGLTISQILQDLQILLKLNLVKKDGFPVKYFLIGEIIKKVSERKVLAEKDHFELRVRIMIQVQGASKTMVEETLKKLENDLRKEKRFFVYEVLVASIIEENDNYSGFLDVNLSVKDFKALIYLSFFYGPESIEVLKPNKYVIEMSNLQDGLNDMTSMIHAYVQYIVKQMNNKELEAFNSKLIKGLDEDDSDAL